MNRGRRAGLAAGIAATIVVLVCLGLSDEIRVQYYLYGLKSNSAEYLERLMGSPEGTAQREAVTRFVTIAPGRQRLLSLTFGALAEDWEQPRLAGSTLPPLKELGHALIGMRLRASKNEWSVWADVRAANGNRRGTMAIVRPSFTSGESLVDVLRLMCAGVEPGEVITLPRYPRLRFRVFPFEEGLRRYDAALGAPTHSIKDTAFWYETLSDWPELFRSEALLSWVIQVDGLDRS